MTKRPNILFLCSDQHRWDALGLHNPIIKTPNLDALAQRGILFDQAICNNPICVPSRYSFSTGLYSHQIGTRNNNQTIQRDQDMPIPTLFERLRDLGYTTIGAGKTHWYMPKQPGRDIQEREPSTRGFDYRFIGSTINKKYNSEPGAIYHVDEDPENCEWYQNHIRKVGGNSGGESIDGYWAGVPCPFDGEGMREAFATRKAIETLKKLEGREDPWHVFLSFDFPHAPLVVPSDYEDLYSLDDIPDHDLPPEKPMDRHYNMWHSDGITEAYLTLSKRERREVWRRYYALCTYIDALYGRILNYLKESGQEEDTFIVFTADHGDSLGERHRFSKYSLYEASVRVPLIVAGAGVDQAKEGTVDSRCAELVDIVPTILSVIGEEIPQNLPGEDLLEPSLRRGGFAEFHSHGYEEIAYAPVYMWRTPEWKLILSYNEGEEEPARNNIINARKNSDKLFGELYDLTEDPQEYNNLYNDPEHFERREAMTRELFYNFALNTCYFPRYSSFANTRPRKGMEEPPA